MMHSKTIVLMVLTIGLFNACEGKNHNVGDIFIDWSDKNPGGPGTGEIPDLYESTRPILVAEQNKHRIIIVDSLSQGIMWEWTPDESELPENRRAWFYTPDEAKPVYNLKYVLITASGGGVALIRIEDKKIMFYAYPVGNPHSAEILPDGNIVTASSNGNTMKIYEVDPDEPYVASPVKTYPLKSGHNVVWDQRTELLWATADETICCYRYDNSNGPNLILVDQLAMPERGGHDLFPVYGETTKLWVTTENNIYVFDVESRTFSDPVSFTRSEIKSISNGPKGFCTLLLEPTNDDNWSSEEVIDSAGLRVYYEQGNKIYKARWFVNNLFSYPEDDDFRYPAK